MCRNSDRESTCALVLGHEVVDFFWNNGQSGCFGVCAHGFLRGSNVLLRMNDEDTKIDVAFDLRKCYANYTLHIIEVHGFHTGLTSSEDKPIDCHMLLHDADLLTRSRMNHDVHPNNKLFTHFECIHVVSCMLKTMYPGWTVVFDTTSSTDEHEKHLVNSVIDAHITLLMDGVTHVRHGVREMVYM